MMMKHRLVPVLAMAVAVTLSYSPTVYAHRVHRQAVNVCRTHPKCLARVNARFARQRLAARGAYARPYRGWLASVRACESGGNYATNTGNGFYGAYQFTLSSWAAVGGRGYPHLASRAEQDYRAIRLLHLQGRGAWPVCG